MGGPLSLRLSVLPPSTSIPSWAREVPVLASLRRGEWGSVAWRQPHSGQTRGLSVLSAWSRVFTHMGLLWALRPTWLLIRTLFLPRRHTSALCLSSTWSVNTSLRGLRRPYIPAPGSPHSRGLHKGPDTMWPQVRDPTEAQDSIVDGLVPRLPAKPFLECPPNYIPCVPQCPTWYRSPHIPTTLPEPSDPAGRRHAGGEAVGFKEKGAPLRGWEQV